MAGLAWQHDKPIQTCNLKDDNTGAVKPGAKAVDAKAAVALPIHDPSGTIRAIVGLAWMHDNELSADAREDQRRRRVATLMGTSTASRQSLPATRARDGSPAEREQARRAGRSRSPC